MKTALLIDPPLNSKSGHHYNATKALAAGIREIGCRVEMLISRQASQELAEELGASRCFTFSIYNRNKWTKAGYNRYCRTFLAELRQGLARLSTLPAIIVFPSCDQVQLECFSRLIGEFDPNWNPFVVAWLLYPPKLHVSPDNRSDLRQHEEYRRAFQSLAAAKKNKGGMFLFCETETLREIYQRLSGREVRLLDPPKLIMPQAFTKTPLRPADKIHLVVLGQTNPAKGYHLLAATLRQVLYANGNIKVTVHGDSAGTGNSGIQRILEEIRDVGPEVNLLTGSLDTDRYYEILGSADLVVLPYDPQSYKSRGSGIYTEATILGLPIIVPMGCDFSAASIEEGRAVGFELYNAESIGEAILRAVNDLERLKRNAVLIATKIKTAESAFGVIANELENQKTLGDLPLRQNTRIGPLGAIKRFCYKVSCLLPI